MNTTPSKPKLGDILSADEERSTPLPTCAALSSRSADAHYARRQLPTENLGADRHAARLDEYDQQTGAPTATGT